MNNDLDKILLLAEVYDYTCSSILSDSNSFLKMAGPIQMGDPINAGKSIADIILFLLKRISPEKRPASVQKLRHKIWNLNEFEIATKKTPNSAALGQSLTFLKTILIGHNPTFIRAILGSVVRNLV